MWKKKCLLVKQNKADGFYQRNLKKQNWTKSTNIKEKQHKHQPLYKLYKLGIFKQYMYPKKKKISQKKRRSTRERKC